MRQEGNLPPDMSVGATCELGPSLFFQGCWHPQEIWSSLLMGLPGHVPVERGSCKAYWGLVMEATSSQVCHILLTRRRPKARSDSQGWETDDPSCHASSKVVWPRHAHLCTYQEGGVLVFLLLQETKCNLRGEGLFQFMDGVHGSQDRNLGPGAGTGSKDHGETAY